MKLTDEQTEQIANRGYLERFSQDGRTREAAARRALVKAGIRAAIAWLERRCAEDTPQSWPTLAHDALADLRKALERGEL
jgi:hypothetical protein